MPKEGYEHIGEKLRNLIKIMLSTDPKDRPDIDQVLQIVKKPKEEELKEEDDEGEWASWAQAAPQEEPEPWSAFSDPEPSPQIKFNIMTKDQILKL